MEPAEWAAELETLAGEFRESAMLLKALGNEMRQRLILTMIQHADGLGTGMRVGDIAAEMNLSRPAASHHLKILKDCGLLVVRTEGTKNFYYFNRGAPAVSSLLKMLSHAQRLMESAPEESL